MELDLGRDRKGIDEVLSTEGGKKGNEAEPTAGTVDFCHHNFEHVPPVISLTCVGNFDIFRNVSRILYSSHYLPQR